MRYGKHINSPTPQSQPIHGKDMTKNDAGGYGFKVTDWNQLQRFLILGTEGGSYYVGEQKITLTNLTAVQSCIKTDGLKVVKEIVEISDQGRAIKNDPAIFALAMCMKYGNIDTRQAAYAAIPKVCRIGTHMFTLCEALKDLDKGWGRGLKKAVGKWYLEKEPKQLAYQVAKYQQRNGWSNADLLRLSHPKSTDPVLNAIFSWVVDGFKEGSEALPKLLNGVELAKKAATAKEVVSLIREYELPRECIPTAFLNEKEVWECLLESMPMTAMIRNLGTMTKNGVLTATSDSTQLVIKRLTDEAYLKKSRIHPIAVLMAMKTYESGTGFRGSNTWKPVQKIVSALDKAFYKAFANVEPTGKNFMIGIDVSGSMTWAGNTGGVLTAAECAAAIAMVIMKTEPKYYAYGFSDKFIDLKIHDGMSLTDVIAKTSGMTFGRTDCALPMIEAEKMKLDIDVFIVITDNDTWAGHIHPTQALASYNKTMGKNAKMISLATMANATTIADPSDPKQIDLRGFDSSIPQAISSFVLMD